MRIIHFNPDYSDKFWGWYHDVRLKSFFRGYEKGVSRQQMAMAPAWMRAHILLGFAEDPLTSPPVGAITFADDDPILRIYKMGLLVDPEQQNKGYGRQLVEGGIDWAFRTMKAHKVFAKMLISDARILQGAQRFGFMKEGTLRDSVYLFGKYFDQELFAILAKDYFGGFKHDAIETTADSK